MIQTYRGKCLQPELNRLLALEEHAEEEEEEGDEDLRRVEG
jgi:hypothetical protein